MKSASDSEEQAHGRAPGRVASGNEELLEILACEIGARPAGAPHFGDVEAAVRTVRREAAAGGQGDALVVEFDPAVAETLKALVAAEKQCCGEIGWHLELPSAQQSAAILRVEASPAQFDALAPMFGTARAI